MSRMSAGLRLWPQRLDAVPDAVLVAATLIWFAVLAVAGYLTAQQPLT